MGSQDSETGLERHETARRHGCAEGRRLLDVFSETVQTLVVLHEQQFLAAVGADSGANRFDLLIHDANETKQAAKYAYMRHLEEHGCSLQNEINQR